MPCHGCNCNVEQVPSSLIENITATDKNAITGSKNSTNASNVLAKNMETNLHSDSKFTPGCKVLLEKKDFSELIKVSNKVNDPKFTPGCKVLLQKTDISELTKVSNKVNDSIQSKNSNKHALTNRYAGLETEDKITLAAQTTTSKELYIDLQKINKRNNNVERVSSRPKKSLRKQIKPNYAEVTLDTSQEEESFKKPEEKIVNKIPIYKQQIEDKKNNIPDNLYEFDESDSDKDKPPRKGKRFPNKSRKPNKSLYMVSQRNHLKKAKSKVTQQKKGLRAFKNTSTKYNQIMQGIIQKVMEKVNPEQKPTTKDRATNKNIIQGTNTTKKPASIKNKEQPTGIVRSNTQANFSQSKASLLSSEVLSKMGKRVEVVKAAVHNLSPESHLEITNITTKNNTGQENLNEHSITQSNYEGDVEQENSDHSFLSSDKDIRENLDEKDETRSNRKVAPEKDISEDLFASEFEVSTLGITSASHLEYTNILRENSEVQENLKEKSRTYIDHEIIVEKDNSEDIFPAPELDISEQDLSGDERSPSPDINIEENSNMDISAESDNEDRSEQDIIDESFTEVEGQDQDLSLKTNPRINIISDVALTRKDSNLWSNSNSTMLPTTNHNPWRFNDYTKRNPHFIILKTTALPCLKQDMVLDYSQVEKIEEHFSKVSRRVETPKKNVVQKSILEYVNMPDSSNKENQPRSSLFDNDDFSPIKTKSSQQSNLKNRAKRNILAPIQNNASNVGPITSTPTRNSLRKVSFNTTSIRNDENEDIANYFGFVDDEVISSKGVKSTEAKPYRVYGNIHKNAKEVSDVEELEEILAAEVPGESQEVNSMDIKLFEDPEKDFTLNVPSKIYIRKTRRKRLKSVQVENEEDPPKKRKKDMMTKAEEAELENWAAEFNSMCAEIDKYDLEIE